MLFYQTKLNPKAIRFLAVVLFIQHFFAILCCCQNDFNLDQITSLSGLSHNTVYAITQDEQGFMWFGTREGLNRYDGENIITYYANPADSTSLISNQVSSLLACSGEGLFVGTYAGLSYFDKRREVFTEVLKPSPGAVNKIYQASDSAIFVCSSGGLFVSRNGSTKFERLPLAGPARDIIEFKKGIYWVLSPYRIRMINSFGEVIKEYKSFSGDLGEPIALYRNASCLFKSKNGTVWLGTIKNGLFKYNPDRDGFESILPDPKYNRLEVFLVRAIEEDMQGNLWIGTESGLFIYNPKNDSLSRYGQSLDHATGLNDKAIYALLLSKENIIWVGTYFGGVNVMRPKRKGFYTLESDGGQFLLSGKAVSDVIKDRAGKYWIATEDGGINIWDRSSHQTKYLKNKPDDKHSLRVNNVHALHEDKDGTVWIGTFLGGLNRYDTKTGKVARLQGPASNNHPEDNMVYSTPLKETIRELCG